MGIRHLLIGSASTLALLGGTAHAQSTNPPGEPPTNAPPSGAVQPAPSDTGSGEAIVITGFRRSIEASIRAKRNSSVIADVLTAEDIGKFPDKNVAEALQRIPGVVINREFGEGERVSVRGTAHEPHQDAPERPQCRDGRLVHPRPAECDARIQLSDSAVRDRRRARSLQEPEADIEEGGVGATINVHTRNPLDLDPLTISASAQMVYSERAKKWDPQASGFISWKNAGDTFGVLVAAVYQKRRIRRDGVEVLGYFRQLDNPATPNVNEEIAGGAQIPSLIGSALFQQERERTAATRRSSSGRPTRSRSTSPAFIHNSTRTTSTRISWPGAPTPSAAAER